MLKIILANHEIIKKVLKDIGRRSEYQKKCFANKLSKQKNVIYPLKMSIDFQN